MTLPVSANPAVMTDRYPTFNVVNGVVHLRIGGSHHELREDESRWFRRHGNFVVAQAGRNYGRVIAILPDGSEHMVKIPPCEHLTVFEGKQYHTCHMQLGFVCPSWALQHWNPHECTVEPCTDGSYVVLDHSLNGVEVYFGTSLNECLGWLKGKSNAVA